MPLPKIGSPSPPPFKTAINKINNEFKGYLDAICNSWEKVGLKPLYG
jgi:hypothetical protein